MEFKYASSILFSNIGYIVKLMLWIFLCVLLVVGVAVAIFAPIVSAVIAHTDVMTFVGGIGDSFDAFINAKIGIKAFVTEFLSGISLATGAVASYAPGMVGSVFAIIFIYLFYCFVSGFSHYPMADIINNLMSSNLKFGLASNMALNFKKAVKYSAARMLVTLPFDLLIAAVMIGATFGFYSLIKLFALPILLVMGILCVTCRGILLSGWLPRLLYYPDEKVFVAFSRSFVFIKHNFIGLFKAYIIIYSCSYMFMGALLLPTFGLIALIIPSIYYFLLRTVELISFYKLKGYRFYTDASTVINTVEFGYRLDMQAADDNHDYTDADSDLDDINKFKNSIGIVVNKAPKEVGVNINATEIKGKNDAKTGINMDKNDVKTGINMDKNDAKTGINTDKNDIKMGINIDKNDIKTGINTDKNDAKTGINIAKNTDKNGAPKGSEINKERENI